MESENTDDKKNLVGRLDVHIGDLVCLRNPLHEVSGYVVRQTLRYVKLSHENPLRPIQWTHGERIFPTRGNRTYELRFFLDYEILKENK